MWGTVRECAVQQDISRPEHRVFRGIASYLFATVKAYEYFRFDGPAIEHGLVAIRENWRHASERQMVWQLWLQSSHVGNGSADRNTACV